MNTYGMYVIISKGTDPEKREVAMKITHTEYKQQKLCGSKVFRLQIFPANIFVIEAKST